MRNIPFILIFVVSFQLCFSQGHPLDEGSLLSKVLKQLNLHESDINIDLLYVEEYLPLSKSKILMVIPHYQSDEKEAIYVVIVDYTTEKIVNKYLEIKNWYSGIPVLNKIELDNRNYKLNNTTMAFGIKFHYTMNSRVNPYEITEFTLFIPENKSLKKVLANYPIYEYKGEVNDGDMCSSWFITLESVISVDEKKVSNGYNGLVVMDIINYCFDYADKKKYVNQEFEYNGNEYEFKQRSIYDLINELQ